MTATDWLTRNGRYVAAGFLVLGLAVRLRHYLAAPSYWYDEAYLLLNIFDHSFRELAGPLHGDQAAPPLFLWSLRALYVTAGKLEWAMRFPAFAASVLSVLLMIPLARRFVGSPGWPWAVAFLAVCRPAAFHTVCVKPYALDLLAVEIAFLAAVGWLAAGRWWRLVGLFAVAALLPWLSFPGVFALAGVSAALAVAAVRRRCTGDGILCAAFSGAWVLSAAAVWFLIGRHQHTGTLEAYWQPFFLDLSSVPAAARWLAVLPVRVGSYATSGLGLPLAALACVGVVSLARRAPELLSLPLGMFAAALAANALRKYPLEDRLVFFAAPGIWLLAAAGIGAIIQRLSGRRVWLVAAVLAAALVPDGLRYAEWLAEVPSKAEFREAFEYVEARQTAGDLWWVSHREVLEVYRGPDAGCLCGTLTADQARPRCLGHPVWVIIPPLTPEPIPFRDLGYELHERKEFRTMHVLLYCPRDREPPPSARHGP
ncbi:MAG: hypothetical protein ACJ8F7_13845 [Gemmataceae bacterium]